jgi:hypothetical protein
LRVSPSVDSRDNSSKNHRLQAVEKTVALEEQNNLVHNGADVLLLKVDNKVGLGGGLVRVVDTGEVFDVTLASGIVDALAVGLLTVLEGSSDVDQEEGAGLLNELAGRLAGILEGSDGGGDDSGTSLGQLRGDESNALNVKVTVLASETKLGGELVSHVLTEKHRDGTTTTLVESGLESTSDLVLSAVLVTSHEDCETLLGRERVLLTEDLDDLRVGEPLGDLLAGAETVAELSAGDVEGAGVLGDLVDGEVLVRVGEVDHGLELDHLDTKLLLVLLDEDLSIIRTVVVLTLLVLTGTGVVTTDDEVGSTVVLSDNGMPESLTGTTHAHSKGKEGEGGHAVGVSGQESLVDTDTGEVVNVTGLGETDDGLDEDVGLLRAGSADRQLTVSTVHGVSGLESNDLLPAELVEVSAELRGSESEVEEVVVLELVDSLKLTANVELLSSVEEVLDTGVSVIIAAKDLLGLIDLVRLVDILDSQDGEVSVVTEIAECDASTVLDSELVDLGLVDIEVDGHREEGAISETVVLNNAIEVLLGHETFKRREATVEDKLKIAKVSLAEGKSRKLLSLRLELGLARQVTSEKVL